MQLAELFEQAGCAAISPPILQPADPFLNAAGEALRKRLFMTGNSDGETLCLRPEFTIPVCLAHEGPARRYHYQGTVFRQRGKGQACEFEQAGVEALGDKDFAKADADMVRLALAAITSLCDCRPEVVIGDPAFFNALVAPVGLPDIWQQRLTRTFGDPALVNRVFSRMLDDTPQTGNRFRNETIESLEEAVAAMITKQGLDGAGGRRASEIAARYVGKRDERTEISDRMIGLCKLFLDIHCKAETVGQIFSAFGNEHQIDFYEAITSFDKRIVTGLDQLEAPITFSAAFGRRLDYYTGFVFEIYDADNRDKGPLAGGGRYDRLMDMLGRKPLPAVGFSLWLDRMGGA